MPFLEERRIVMSKILLKINNDEDLTYPADGYVLGINDFSYLFGKTYSIDEIKKIVENTNKEIYVSFNRIIFNEELNLYKKVLLEADNIGLKGIIVGDIAALTYKLKTNVILDQMHLNNNYYTINHYYNNGVNGIMLTNDITKEEINEIRNNTNITLYKEIFGYPHLSTSRRYLISNYLEYFKINNKSSYYEIKEDNSDNYYKVIEDEFGCHILADRPINLLGVNLNVDYLIINGLFIENIKEVVDIFVNNDVNKKEYLNDKYNCTQGFIDKKTIYKVKHDEK